MAKRMLIDAAHPEETRVVVTGGTRLEEFDFESSTKKQVKGNIYLAKITRVEPSLQAAFVDYGGNRHGFLAFSEIHPDYYRIPVSDRRYSDAEQPAGNGAAATDGEDRDSDDAGVPLAAALPEPVPVPEPTASDDDAIEEAPERDHEPEGEALEAATEAPEPLPWSAPPAVEPGEPARPAESADTPIAAEWEVVAPHQPIGDSAVLPAPPAAVLEPEGEPATIALRATEESVITAEFVEAAAGPDAAGSDAAGLDAAGPSEHERFAAELGQTEGPEGDTESEAYAEAVEISLPERETVETLGGDEVEEVEEADAERRRTQPSRHYKIQEVIKRRQIMLVQVAKEERGNKGAALTTYLSLAGRYCVLMPNTNRGGGVSRKITSIADRRRLKEILEELEIPEGMGVIVRTAGAERSKAEIKRDYEYLLRLWNEIRDLTLQSTAPALIYEEGNLIKRSIRDLYTRDIEEVLVEGEEGYKTAKAFMRTLMPSHAKRVQPFRDPQIPLFQRFQIESQIDAIHSPVAQLRSGGYVVINQTEALVAIDVNSGRSTRERNIEETALRTNIEAAEEIARQLRLRDLAGLIVIDFIDMEEHRNQIAVERRLKEALKNDRARIQVGRISPFGLLEMSRQRLRPSLAEASTQPCPHCGGTGFIRSVESTALYVLRSIEEEGIRRRSAEICVYVPTTVALYILNQKRDSLAQIEARYGLRVMIARDDSLIPPAFRLERLRSYAAGETPPLRAIQAPTLAEDEEDEEEVEAEAEIEAVAADDEAAPEAASDDERGRRRRRRRRRRGDDAQEVRPSASATAAAAAAANGAATGEADGAASGDDGEAARDGESEAERRRRRRGRRGGRMRPRRGDGHETAAGPAVAAETVEVVPADDDPRDAAEPETLPGLSPWPADAGLEAASLAPLAGEIEAAAGHGQVRDDSEHRAAEEAAAPTAEAEQGVPFVSHSEHLFEEAASEARAERPEEPPVAAPTAEAEEAAPFVSHAERVLEEAAAEARAERPAEPPATDPGPGAGYDGQGERVLEEAGAEAHGSGEPAHMPPPRPGDEVLTVTEKPANPRRGWWQRMTQS